MREARSRAVAAALFAVERVREGVTELVGSVVYELIDEGTLNRAMLVRSRSLLRGLWLSISPGSTLRR